MMIREAFERKYKSDPTIRKWRDLLEAGKATQEDVRDYSLALGKLLAQVVADNGGLDVDEDVYLILYDSLGTETQYIREAYYTYVQDPICQGLRMRITAQPQTLDKAAVQTLSEKVLTSADRVATATAGIEDYAQEFYNTEVKRNAQVLDKAGVKIHVTREYEGPHERNGRNDGHKHSRIMDCEFCLSAAYSGDLKNAPSNFWVRHQGCRCLITYKGERVENYR